MFHRDTWELLAPDEGAGAAPESVPAPEGDAGGTEPSFSFEHGEQRFDSPDALRSYIESGFVPKADFTRMRQADAEQRKTFEEKLSQREAGIKKQEEEWAERQKLLNSVPSQYWDRVRQMASAGMSNQDIISRMDESTESALAPIIERLDRIEQRTQKEDEYRTNRAKFDEHATRLKTRYPDYDGEKSWKWIEEFLDSEDLLGRLAEVSYLSERKIPTSSKGDEDSSSSSAAAAQAAKKKGGRLIPSGGGAPAKDPEVHRDASGRVSLDAAKAAAKRKRR